MYIMRHGRTVWNRDGKLQGRLNSPLLESSLDVAKAIANFLSNANIERVYASPLQRCVHTAEIVCRVLNTAFVCDDRLMECDHGICEGLTLVDASARYPAELALREKDKWITPWPDGESYADVYGRAKLFYDSLGSIENTLVISHETFNRCLIGYGIGWPAEEIMAFRQPNTMLCKIDLAYGLQKIEF
jgi:probable phosphoglycerate mutase